MAILTIAGTKGGTGKSTTAINLIHHLKPTKIVELDVHKGISRINQVRKKQLNIIIPKTSTDLISVLESDNDNELIIIDCGGYDNDMTRLAIANADVVLAPTSDDPTEQYGLELLNDVLQQLSDKTNTQQVAHILINKVHHSRRNFDSFIELAELLPCLELLPVSLRVKRSQEIVDAMFSGEAVKKGAISDSYKSIAKHILKMLN